MISHRKIACLLGASFGKGFYRKRKSFPSVTTASRQPLEDQEPLKSAFILTGFPRVPKG
jgi:hypothetical protein